MSGGHLEWHGERVRAAADAGADRGLDRALEHLLGASTAIAPIEEGTLIRSGKTSRAGKHGAVSYDTVYAARQHEELTWRHDPGRSAKYLEIPFHGEAPTMLGIIAAAIREELGT